MRDSLRPFDLRVLTSNAARTVLDDLARIYQGESGQPITIESESASVMLERIRNGESADLAVLNAPDMADLVSRGILCLERPFARSRIGVAVRSGVRHPDISSVDALKRALLDAGTVAHTVHGASGKLVPALLEKLGIAGQVRTVTRTGGLIAKVVVAGEAEIAIQQVSELLAVPGAEVVGLLPEELQTVLYSSAGVFAASSQSEAAESLLRFFTTPAAANAMAERGLEAAG